MKFSYATNRLMPSMMIILFIKNKTWILVENHKNSKVLGFRCMLKRKESKINVLNQLDLKLE